MLYTISGTYRGNLMFREKVKSLSEGVRLLHIEISSWNAKRVPGEYISKEELQEIKAAWSDAEKLIEAWNKASLLKFTCEEYLPDAVKGDVSFENAMEGYLEATDD